MLLSKYKILFNQFSRCLTFHVKGGVEAKANSHTPPGYLHILKFIFSIFEIVIGLPYNWTFRCCILDIFHRPTRGSSR